MKRAPFQIAGKQIQSGSRATLEIPLSDLYTPTALTMPVQVAHGRRDGPVVFISAAVHGDEILGVEIIRRLFRMPTLHRLRGTLISAPIVNVYGFNNRSRYLPDRRDLNRSFPGSEQGTMAARLAHIFLAEVVKRSDLGIDLHTAAIHRENLPQIRADLSDPILAPLAHSFAAPVLLNSAAPPGSLRGEAAALNVPVMVYEAGEALRFDEVSAHIGLRGILNVLRRLSMLPSTNQTEPSTVVMRSSNWVRAGKSGILRLMAKTGAAVSKGDVLGVISNAFGAHEEEVLASYSGVIIGRCNLPLVYAGEALFHIGRTSRPEPLSEQMGEMQLDTDENIPFIIEEPAIV